MKNILKLIVLIFALNSTFIGCSQFSDEEGTDGMIRKYNLNEKEQRVIKEVGVGYYGFTYEMRKKGDYRIDYMLEHYQNGDKKDSLLDGSSPRGYEGRIVFSHNSLPQNQESFRLAVSDDEQLGSNSRLIAVEKSCLGVIETRSAGIDEVKIKLNKYIPLLIIVSSKDNIGMSYKILENEAQMLEVLKKYENVFLLKCKFTEANIK